MHWNPARQHQGAMADHSVLLDRHPLSPQGAKKIHAGIDQEGWMEVAQDRAQWKQLVNGIREPEGGVEVHTVLARRAGV